MKSREELGRELEQRLYAYAFDADASHAFRGYNDVTRIQRFREHYTHVLGKDLQATFPIFAKELGPLSPELVARHRIELRTERTPREIADHVVARFSAYVEEHPRAGLLRELLRLERAAFLARSEPSSPLSIVLERLDELAAIDPAPSSSVDLPGLHYCSVTSSLPEALAMPSRRASLLDWCVRLEEPRRCVTYVSSVDGAVHRKCAATFDELREEMALRSRGVDI